MINLIAIEEHWSIIEFVTSAHVSLVTMLTFPMMGFVTCNMNNLLLLKKATYGI
jgi:hypothetical protein